MTTAHVMIESLMADRANAAYDEDVARYGAHKVRRSYGPRPYNSTTWQGWVDLPENETDAEQLERIFRLFNRVTEEDVERLAAQGYELPSLSVGDQVTLSDPSASTYSVRAYQVAGTGFDRIS